MGGGEDAHIGFEFRRCAHRANGLFLDRAQQFDLHFQWQVRHFIKKKCAAFCRLEKTLFILVRAGKAAFFVAEKFALH